MTTKDKIILIFLSIITLGIYPIIIFRKKDSSQNKELSVDKKLSINIEKLVLNLGGSINILGSEYTNTKVKVFIKEKEKVNIDGLQNIRGVSGVFASSKYITLIVGKQAKLLANSL